MQYQKTNFKYMNLSNSPLLKKKQDNVLKKTFSHVISSNNTIGYHWHQRWYGIVFECGCGKINLPNDKERTNLL